MKGQLLTVVAVTLMTISCRSQDISPNKVPSVVLNTVKAKYPAAQDVDWEKHSNYYEAELDLNDSTEVTLRIDAAGTLLMQKQDVSVYELPNSITTVLQNQYKDYHVDDVEKLEKDGSVYYQVELERNGEKDVKRVFAADGREEKTIAYWE